ncbi:MAG: choice-of-anchor D domain-containing protein [Acidimicrobiia bacterium]|nr:choice-of-anchor D domain-containing protein [Acidimicrobiia bacterium]
MTRIRVLVLAAFCAAPAHAALDKLPLRFEPNQGQAPAAVQFLARGPGYSLGLDATGATLASGGSLLRMVLVEANRNAAGKPEQPLGGSSHYLRGGRESWQTGVAHYGRVRYRDVYPGIDVFYYGNPAELEYDFILRPGADPRRIRLQFEGARSVSLDSGDLVVETESGKLRHKAPHAYQQTPEGRRRVEARYRLSAQNRVEFELAAYDRTRELIIDPVILFSTYYGGQLRDEARSIALDTQGNVYVAGLATSMDYPVTPGALKGRITGTANDLFIVKINSTGTQVLYSTLLGGTDEETVHSMAVNEAGEVFLGGATRSADFPTTAGALITAPQGGLDGFVLKLNSTGSGLIYSTRIGGRGNDTVYGIDIDAAGSAYVAGETGSADYPVTPDVFQTQRKGATDCFVTKLSAAGSAMIYSTLLGGDADSSAIAAEGCRAIAVDRFGMAHVGGITTLRDFPVIPSGFQSVHGGLVDSFVVKFNETATTTLISTFIGGESADTLRAVAVDASGNVYAAGGTSSMRFPTTPGVVRSFFGGGTLTLSDGWVTKLTANGTTVFSTYIAGTGDDQINGMRVDATGMAYLVGTTNSTDFPVTSNAVQLAKGSGSGEPDDAFITQLDPLGQQIVFSTYLGGSRNEIGAAIARDSMGNIFVAGYTQSNDFPRNPGALQRSSGFGTTTSFITRIGDTTTAPARVIVISGNNQTADQDTELPLPLVVEVRDQFHNPMANVLVNFSAVNAVVSAPSQNTGADGRASIRARLGNRGATATVSATFGNLPPAQFTFTVIRTGPPLPAINTAGVVGGGLSSPPQARIALNGIAAVFGNSFAPPGTLLVAGANDLVGGRLPTNLGGVCVTIHGTAARIISVTPTHINLQVPDNVAPGDGRVVVIINCGVTGELRSDEERVVIASVSPELFSVARASGRNYVAAVNAVTGAFVAPGELVPGAVNAQPNDNVMVFGTGFGPTNPPVPTGELAAGAARTALPVVVILDGEELPAELVPYAGAAPGLAGVYQVNFRVPARVRNGDLRLSIRVGEFTAPLMFLRVAGGLDISPRLAVTPARVDFGDVFVGQARELPLTISNAGSAGLTITEIALSPSAFSLSSTAGFRLNPGEQRILQVRFQAAQPGQFSANIVIRSDAEANAELSVPLTANSINTPPPPNPAPSLTSLSPTSVEAGGSGFNLLVNGAGFVRASVVQWNGQARSTFFNHAGQLIAAITTADIAAAGTAQVTVFTPEPGGGRTAALPFTITASTQAGARVLLNQIQVQACPEINTLAMVLNRDGQPVAGLPTPSCTEDGDPIACTLGVTGELPLSVVLAISLNGLAAQQDITLLQTAVRGFVNRLPDNVRIALVHVESDARPLLGFTEDRGEIHRFLDLLRPVGAGNALIDAVGLVNNLVRDQAGRRLAVVLITAQDTLSGVLRDPGQVLLPAQQSGAPYFAFAIGAGAADVNLTGFLRQLGRDTGGQLVQEASSLNFDRMLRTMGELLASQYRVQHTVRQLNAQPHTLRFTFLGPDGAISGTRSFRCTP